MKKRLAIISACLLLSIGGFVCFKHFFLDKSQHEAENTIINDTDAINDDEELSIEPIDAVAYLNKIGDISDQYNISDSQNTMTESETMTFLKERGFAQYPIVTSFSMNGEYLEQFKILGDSDVKHPIYETYFIGDNNLAWKITVVNGVLFADLLNYDYQEKLETPIVLSETDYIISYDNITNKYYKLEPYADAICIKVVEKIDADLLKSLTEERIGDL